MLLPRWWMRLKTIYVLIFIDARGIRPRHPKTSDFARRRIQSAVMAETISYDCPNCSAPVTLPLGEVETVLRFLPDEREMEVVRTREEMKRRERVAIQKAMLKKQLDQEEMARWRNTAARVAIAALPVVGDVAGRAMFRSAVHRGGGGCAGCGCLGLAAALLAALAAL